MGKLYWIEFKNILFKFEPFPDIKTQAFFYHRTLFTKFSLLIPFEILPII